MKNLTPLSKAEMKKVMGGDLECGPSHGNAVCPEGMCCSEYGYCGTNAAYCGGDDSGRCVQCTCSSNNLTSCWYSKRSAHDLCVAVCGSVYFSALDPVTCYEGCTMN